MADSTADVLADRLGSFGSGNLAGILADYTADSILITANGALRGPSEISPLFEGMLAEFAKPGASFQMTAQTVEGEVAYIVWSAETADNAYELGTDTFIVRDGKIAIQTLAAKITPKG
jgi:hypothetical protein